MGPGQRLGEVDAHEQRAREPRAVGDRDAVDVGHGDAGRGERLVQHGHDPAQVGPRRDLGHDAAGRRMERDLARDDVGVDPAAVLDQRDAGLVARRLDGQEQRTAHAPRSGRVLRARGAGGVAGRVPVVGLRGRRGGGVQLRAQAGDPPGHRRLGQRLGGHDQRVFLVVAVVARADAHGPEPVLLVQPARGEVGQADLEGRLARVAVRARGPAATGAAAPRCAGGGSAGARRRSSRGPRPPSARCRRRQRSPRRWWRPGTGRAGSPRAPGGRRGPATGVVNEARSMSWTAGQVGHGHRAGSAGRGVRTLIARAPGELDGVVAGSVADAARERHVLGHEAGEVVRVPGREAGRARGQHRRREARVGGIAQRDRVVGRATREVHGDEPLARTQLRVRAAGQDHGRARPARDRTRSDGPAGWSSTTRRRPLRPPAAARSALPVATPAIGSRRAWARPFAVAIPTRSPVNAPGPSRRPGRRATRARWRDRAAAPRSGPGAPRRGGSRPSRTAPRSAARPARRAR